MKAEKYSKYDTTEMADYPEVMKEVNKFDNFVEIEINTKNLQYDIIDGAIKFTLPAVKIDHDYNWYHNESLCEWSKINNIAESSYITAMEKAQETFVKQLMIEQAFEKIKENMIVI